MSIGPANSRYGIDDEGLDELIHANFEFRDRDISSVVFSKACQSTMLGPSTNTFAQESVALHISDVRDCRPSHSTKHRVVSEVDTAIQYETAYALRK